jgi:hypothetical protein
LENYVSWEEWDRSFFRAKLPKEKQNFKLVNLSPTDNTYYKESENLIDHFISSNACSSQETEGTITSIPGQPQSRF